MAWIIRYYCISIASVLRHYNRRVVAPGTLAESRMAPRPTLVATPSLRYWRTQIALPQSELARLAEVDRATVVRLEAGGSARLSTVRRLAVALEISPAQLLVPPPA
jgi:DNA-binding XRE family transcriptional regulator